MVSLGKQVLLVFSILIDQNANEKSVKKPHRVTDPKQILTSPLLFLAFGFGSGLSPVVPGTVGTLAAIPIYLLMLQMGWVAYLLVLVFLAIIGIFICDRASQKLGVNDHSGIVWDEFVGFWITMLFVPFSWFWLVVGFILFRFFDMVKPWPISLADKHVHGGWGIMLDDILAGFAALAVLHFLIWWSI